MTVDIWENFCSYASTMEWHRGILKVFALSVIPFFQSLLNETWHRCRITTQGCKKGDNLCSTNFARIVVIKLALYCTLALDVHEEK